MGAKRRGSSNDLDLRAREQGVFSRRTLLACLGGTVSAGLSCSTMANGTPRDDGGAGGAGGVGASPRRTGDASADGVADAARQDDPPAAVNADPRRIGDASADGVADAAREGDPPGASVVYHGGRIMCTGDSLTVGIGSTGAGGGYRRHLFASMPDFVPVGTSTEQPLDSYGLIGKNHHQGIGASGSGYLELQIGAVLDQVGAVDVMLIHYGTNDGDAGTGARIAASCAKVLERNPKCRFLIASPHVNPRSDVDAAHANLYPLIVASVATAIPSIPNATACPMPFLDDADLGNPLHPNDAGYEKMALAWLKSLSLMTLL